MSTPQGIRNDIQALRALAVVLVVAYHAKIPNLNSGFLGVDVFFVISGFLIANAIESQRASGEFRFASFYWRRAFRLLPASYVVLLFVILVAPHVLTTQEIGDLFWQVLGTVTFTSNMVLWSQAGYFGGEAALKPLLHTWSLSIEEQFYLFLPLLLVHLQRPRRNWMLLLMLFGSIALLIAFRHNPSAAFYFLPTRAWELMLGVGVALCVRKRGHVSTPAILRFGAIGTILAAAILPTTPPHPGLSAGVVCCATALILASQPRQVDLPSARLILYIGAISYSLYLVHWPLFAFYNNVSFGRAWNSPGDTSARVLLIAASILLAAILHRFVEDRFRTGNSFSGKSSLIAGVVLIVAIAYLVLVYPRSQFVSPSPKDALTQACETHGAFNLNAACGSPKEPRILLWGDSYAMHLVPGLSKSADDVGVGVVHAARSACGPFVGVAQNRLDGGYDRKWAQSCIEFNDSVLAAINASPEIDIVVLSSPFVYLIDNPEGVYWRDDATGKLDWRSANFRLAHEVLTVTVAKIRASGKKVVIIAPPPTGPFDLGRCGRRLTEGLPKVGVDKNCRFVANHRDSPRVRSRELLESVSSTSNVTVIYLDSVSCTKGICEGVASDMALYRDESHLSNEGSVYIAKTLNLAQQVLKEAR